MRIHSNALGAVKGVAQYHVRRLPSHARELYERLHCLWHSAVVLQQQGCTTALNSLGFLTIKAGRLDILC
jgi:hypothetical protein